MNTRLKIAGHESGGSPGAVPGLPTAPSLRPTACFITDRLGTTRAVNGVARNYYPFGEEIGSTANDQYKFASTYRDSTTGLDYAINRYYASGMGRFLRVDPYRGSAFLDDPQTLNRYTYAENDPVNLTDPLGLCPPGMVEADSSEDTDRIVSAATSYLGHDIAHASGQHFDVKDGVLKAMDCSGLVSQALSGTAYSSPFTEGPKGDEFSSSGTSSLFAADTGFHRGDIIDFGGHVAIVTEASASGAITKFVGAQTSGVAEVDVSKNSYWAGRLSSAKAYKPCVPAAWHQPPSGVGGGGGGAVNPGVPTGSTLPFYMQAAQWFSGWMHSIQVEVVTIRIKWQR
jgi:RHS repeat-associated protein